MKKNGEKRARLIEAAKKLIFESGYHKTTLSEIAQEAQVPLGNVYYYFKTKQELGEAVLEERQADFQAIFAQWDSEIDDPKQRVRAWLALSRDWKGPLAEHGCSLGSLCEALEKSRDELAEKASELLQITLDWLAQQFVAMGKSKSEAAALALHLLSANQGSIIISQAFADAQLASREANHLEHWLDTL